MFGVSWKNSLRKRHDEFNQALAEFSKSLTLIVDLEQLKDNVISKIREIIHVDTIMIYLLSPDFNRFYLAEVRGVGDTDTTKDQLYFLPDNPLISWFTINETHLSVSENPQVFSYFNNHEQKILKETKIELIFPLMVMNRISGLVCLGSKSSGESFKNGEIELLNTLLGQAAFAFENAYLYQQQKSRLRKMYRADRLATLGQLAAGAAHEIRNPLTTIRSTIQYLQKDLQEEKNSTLVAELLGEVDRINEIIEGLLSFSKPAKLQIERVNLEHLLEQTVNLVATTAKKKGIEIGFDYKASDRKLNADPAQLKQVFLNISMNALQAMENGGKLLIEVDVRKSVKSISKAQNSFYIVFRDSGAGIPVENLEHIFDPFFTTKKDGTGLGLSISYGIIQQHHGDIEIESYTKDDRPEKHGTKVMITLPVLE